MKLSVLLKGISGRDRHDALWLLSALLSCQPGELLVDRDRALSPLELRRWMRWWREREAGKPLQRICGLAPFYGREFSVSAKALIPRPETERLVELALGLLAGKRRARVLDVGTGSGVIAVTLKLERPDLELTASDISPGALALARTNGKRLAAAGIRWVKADLLGNGLAAEPWDLIVSNPPYLDLQRDFVAPQVRAWDPLIALEPGAGSDPGSGVSRAAWCAESLLLAVSSLPRRPLHCALELSPRVAWALEQRWRKKAGVRKVWREGDLAGRKRFLLVAWENGLF